MSKRSKQKRQKPAGLSVARTGNHMQKMKVTPIPGGGWVIKSSTGETHRKIYPSARKAAASLERITEGLIRFEPTPVINTVSWMY